MLEKKHINLCKRTRFRLNMFFLVSTEFHQKKFRWKTNIKYCCCTVQCAVCNVQCTYSTVVLTFLEKLKYLVRNGWFLHAASKCFYNSNPTSRQSFCCIFFTQGQANAKAKHYWKNLNFFCLLLFVYSNFTTLFWKSELKKCWA